MIRCTQFRDRTVMVMGLARSGAAAVRALLAGGADVVAWDDRADRRAALAGSGARLCDPAAVDWQRMAGLVLSPGIPHRHPRPHPAAAAALAAGVPLIGDIELLLGANPEPRLVAVTGTNGKSTTTALIGHMLEAAGMAAAVGGNLGPPALDFAPLGGDGVQVVELSSYQLELTPSLAPAVALLLNISPDHLDRHGGMEGYVAAKCRVFGPPGGEGRAIVGVDDPLTAGIADRLVRERPGRVTPISGTRPVEGGVFADGGRLIDDRAGRAAPILDLAAVETLPGAHNAQNAAAAWAAVTALGLPGPAAAAAIAGFPGLVHRQELVARHHGVRYVNDSKATNADAAVRALDCYDSIYWIAGGRAKGAGLGPIAGRLARIRHAYLIGESAPDLAGDLAGRAACSLCGTLDAAVPAAHALAQREGLAGATVLLSPAAASFDQFADFEARGDRFRVLVRALVGQPDQDVHSGAEAAP